MLWRNATVSLYTTQLPMYCCVWISTWLTAALSHLTERSQAVGVAGRICAVAKRAVHTHCHMHCVNLAVQDALTAVSFMRDFLNFIHDLIVFLRNSPKRCATIRQIATDHERPQTNIRPLSNAVHRSLSGDRKRQTAVSSNC